jgi:hypothetical protein
VCPAQALGPAADVVARHGASEHSVGVGGFLWERNRNRAEIPERVTTSTGLQADVRDTIAGESDSED